jgi:hypothetical protein
MDHGDNTMKYALLFYAPEAIQQSPESYKQWGAFDIAEFEEALKQASGAWAGNIGLASVTNATTIRVREGKTLTTDGPFAETHEQLGGIWVFDLPNLDEAIRLAEKIPPARYGAIEIRPLWGQDQ